MPKYDRPNVGLPLHVDPTTDLALQTAATINSWYVLCNFEVDGRQLGFEWHQQIIEAGPAGLMSSTELLLMDATQGTWLDHAATEPVPAKAHASATACDVVSSFGRFTGNRNELRLTLEGDRGSVDVTLTPTEQVLYNGSTGLLKFLGASSYQFSFPNMRVNGTITLGDEVIEVRDALAWMDRQWGQGFSIEDLAPSSGKPLPSWLWLGMTMGQQETAAISLWDVVETTGEHRVFATILGEDGVQANHLAEVTYEQTWTSTRTGNTYPSKFQIAVPTADVALQFTALLDEPEFDHGEQSISGSQSLCAVTGHYGSQRIDRHAIVELIGDVCGD